MTFVKYFNTIDSKTDHRYHETALISSKVVLTCQFKLPGKIFRVYFLCIMFGEKAFELIKELERTQESLSAFNVRL